MTDRNSSSARCPARGSEVVWPKGVEAMLDISAVTRWRWERTGRLPARDVDIGGKTGWLPETLQALIAKTA